MDVWCIELQGLFSVTLRDHGYEMKRGPRASDSIFPNVWKGFFIEKRENQAIFELFHIFHPLTFTNFERPQ